MAVSPGMKARPLWGKLSCSVSSPSQRPGKVGLLFPASLCPETGDLGRTSLSVTRQEAFSTVPPHPMPHSAGNLCVPRAAQSSPGELACGLTTLESSDLRQFHHPVLPPSCPTPDFALSELEVESLLRLSFLLVSSSSLLRETLFYPGGPGIRVCSTTGLSNLSAFCFDYRFLKPRNVLSVPWFLSATPSGGIASLTLCCLMMGGSSGQK